VARDHAHTFATVANIVARSGMEINFVDPFGCNGYRFKRTARIVPKGALVARVRRRDALPSFVCSRYEASPAQHQVAPFI